MAIGTGRTSRTVLAVFAIQAVLTVVYAADTIIEECNLVADGFAALYNLFDGRHIVTALQHIDCRLQHPDVAVKLAAQGLQCGDPAFQVGNPLVEFRVVLSKLVILLARGDTCHRNRQNR